MTLKEFGGEAEKLPGWYVTNVGRKIAEEMNCKICGTDFQRKRRHQVHCSPSCREAAKRQRSAVIKVPRGDLMAVRTLLGKRRQKRVTLVSLDQDDLRRDIRSAALWLLARLEVKEV